MADETFDAADADDVAADYSAPWWRRRSACARCLRTSIVYAPHQLSSQHPLVQKPAPPPVQQPPTQPAPPQEITAFASPHYPSPSRLARLQGRRESKIFTISTWAIRGRPFNMAWAPWAAAGDGGQSAFVQNLLRFIGHQQNHPIIQIFLIVKLSGQRKSLRSNCFFCGGRNFQ